MSLTSFKGYGLPDAYVAAIQDIVLQILRQDAALKQNTLTNSAGLAGALSNETGTGLAVFSTSPVFTTQIDVPNLRLRNATTAAVVGNSTLVAGTVTVTATQVSASSYILFNRKTAGGATGDITYTVGAGTFTLTSASNTDTSVVTWAVINGY